MKYIMAKNKEVPQSPNTEEVLERISLNDFKKLTESERSMTAQVIFEARVNLWQKIPDIEGIIAIKQLLVRERRGEAVAAKVELEEHTKFLQQVQEKYEEAEEELKAARRKLDKKKANFLDAKRFNENLRKKYEDADKNLEAEEKSLEKMQVIALVHSSATLKQVHKYQLSKIIVTKDDEKLLEEIIPDRIFNPEKADNFIYKLPIGFKERYNEEEMTEIISFCNMVINIKLAMDEGQKVVPLFSNKDIAEILRLNGLEDF